MIAYEFTNILICEGNMRSGFKEARISIYVIGTLLSMVIAFYLIASMFTSMGYKGYRDSLETNVFSQNQNVTIVIDPGHGGEDPGADMK